MSNPEIVEAIYGRPFLRYAARFSEAGGHSFVLRAIALALRRPPLQFEISDRQFSVSRRHWSSSEIHIEARAPDRHCLILAQVRTLRHIVVLITDVTFHGPEVHEPGFLHCDSIFGIRSSHKINVDVRTIRCLEIR